MAKKKAAAKKAAKAITHKAQASPPAEAPEAPKAVTERTLAPGTIVQLPGSNTNLVLKNGDSVTYVGVENDQKFAGMLARHRENFDLNIGQLEGVWSPVTARREE